MNILDFIQYAGTKVRTASCDEVTITEIVREDPYPIKGTFYHKYSGTVHKCEWDVNGYPHRLPTTHGLNLVPYLPKTCWDKIDLNKFKSAESYSDLVRTG